MLRARLDWPDLACAALLAGLVLVCARRRGGRRVLFALALLLPLGAYALSPEHRVYSYHGFLHLSIVYQILEGGLPPANPILAGEALRYMWGPHALVAWLAAALEVSPAWLFALQNLLALAVAILALQAAGRRLFGDAETAALGVAVTLFGFSFVQLARQLGPGLAWIESQGMPPVEKFTNLNALPPGLACYALFLYGLVRVLAPAGDERLGVSLRWLGAAVFGAAFFYPLQWLMLGLGGAAAAALLWLREPALRPRILRAAGAAALGSLLALPYLWAVSSAESAPLLLPADARHVMVYTANLALLALPAAALLAYGREPLRQLARRRSAVLLALAALALPNALVSIFLSGAVSPGVEYKFRMASYLPLGLLAGVGLQRLGRRRPLGALLLLAALLTPPLSDLRAKASWRGGLDPFVENGVHLEHAEPAQAELYAWIAKHTGARAAFVDRWLAIPVFARRPLLIGLDSRASRAGRGRGFHDGWLIDPQQTLLEVIGGARPEIERRDRAARAVLAGRQLGTAAGELRALARRAGIEALYVVAREPGSAAQLAAHPAFAQVFANDAAALFRLVDAPGPESRNPERGPSGGRAEMVE